MHTWSSLLLASGMAIPRHGPAPLRLHPRTQVQREGSNMVAPTGGQDINELVIGSPARVWILLHESKDVFKHEAGRLETVDRSGNGKGNLAFWVGCNATRVKTLGRASGVGLAWEA